MVGYYHSDARYGAAGELPAVGRKVADQIHQKRSGAIALVLDNKKLELFLKGGQGVSPFELFTKDSAKGWKREAPEALQLVGGGSWQRLYEPFVAMYNQQRHRDVVDFEEHLDDPEKDYLNAGFSASGKFALPGNVM